MSKGTRICKECGKEYAACHTQNTNNSFRWQDVACSPECGAIYLEKILLSRSKTPTTKTVVTTEDLDDEDDLFDEVFEIDFDDYDETDQ